MKKAIHPLLLLIFLGLACNLPFESSDEFAQPEEDEIQVPENTIELVEPRHGVKSLDEVQSWLYLIDVNLDQDMVDRIASSTYEMVVLDFIRSESSNTDYPMKEVVKQLHESSLPKLVVAYIDIGEAEEYRTYWQHEWEVGDPEWIVGADPDGWEENYPVAYWWDEWKEIWTAEDGYITAIVQDGFDGVYLDWVEAYSDDNVINAADKDGVNAREEMIWWVEEIGQYGKRLNPNFFEIAQNAAELVEIDSYVEIIDAISQEQVWFDGGADNEPPGDCPLPRTKAEVDTEAYYESLSKVCQRQYDEYSESTLHMSSEEYLYFLNIAKEKGLPVFTVDYALDPQNITWIYKTSRDQGFIPFVGSRALDGYVDPR